MTQLELNELLSKLMNFGEDSAELFFWQENFFHLPKDQQTTIELNLKKQLLVYEQLNKPV
jgi:hypothetical protein